MCSVHDAEYMFGKESYMQWLKIMLACLLLSGCTKLSEKKSPAYQSRLTQIATNREAYYANLKCLSEYSRDLQHRCDRFPQLASVRFPDFTEMRKAGERMDAVLPDLQNNSVYWTSKNRLLLAMETQLQQTAQLLSEFK